MNIHTEDNNGRNRVDSDTHEVMDMEHLCGDGPFCPNLADGADCPLRPWKRLGCSEAIGV